MKLEADAPINPRILDDFDGDVPRGDDSHMEGVTTLKSRKPSQKQRKNAQLRKSNPQREKNPLFLADKHVTAAE